MSDEHSFTGTHFRQRQHARLARQQFASAGRFSDCELVEQLFRVSDIARDHRSHRRYTQAEELELFVLENMEDLGPEHVAVVTSMGNLALTYKRRERWEEAEMLEMTMLRALSTVFGTSHPNTLVIMSGLAETCQRQGKWEEAESLELWATAARMDTLGFEHPRTLIGLNALAWIYFNQGRQQDAEQLGRRVLRVRERMLGAAHPETTTSRTVLAAICEETRVDSSAQNFDAWAQ